MLFDYLNGDQTVSLSSGAWFSPLPPPNGTYHEAGGNLALAYADGAPRASLSAGVDGGQLSLWNSEGSSTVEILAAETSTTGGLVTLRNASGTDTLRIDADEAGSSVLFLYKEDGTLMCELDALDSTSGGQFSMFDPNGRETVEIIAAESPSAGGAQVTLHKRDGTTTITLDADYAGDGRIITQELQITGGSDLCEEFEISAPAGLLRAGLVVSIDPAHPGLLALSTRAYDRMVAGVLSGAGGLKPGIMLGNPGIGSGGTYAVTLTGRVYCWADAQFGAIRPGDLLTTSDTAGHAMKATDSARAQGAVLGKAMTALEHGTGLVLILVSLQ